MNQKNWTNTTIGEICLVGDGAHAKIKRQESGILYLTSRNFKNGKLELSKVDYISENDYKKYFRADSKALTKPHKEDIVFSIIGTIGEPYLYTEKDFFGISSAVSILRPDKFKIDPKYLFYWIKGYIFQNALYAIKGGVAQSYVSLEMIKSLPLNYPTKSIQRKIAGILSAYDDLIENNTRRIEILEEMARMLYREWFVKFRFPVEDGGNGGEDIGDDRPSNDRTSNDRTSNDRTSNDRTSNDRTSNDRTSNDRPSNDRTSNDRTSNDRTHSPELVESELGLIPKGWEVGKIGDVCELLSGYAFKSKDWQDSGIPVIKIKNITSNNTVDIENTDYVSLEIISPKLEKYLLNTGDFLMAMTGATAGKVGCLRSNQKILLNQRVAKINPKESYRAYVWQIISSDEGQKMFFNLADGAAQPNMSLKQIQNVPILIPPLKIIAKYQEIASDLFSRIDNLIFKNINLRKTRDLLLPRLISGEIDVEDLDINLGKNDP